MVHPPQESDLLQELGVEFREDRMYKPAQANPMPPKTE
jgi:hypothetical protein